MSLPEAKAASYDDAEKSASRAGSISEQESHRAGVKRWHQRLLKWGVEARGVHPIPVAERTDTAYSKLFTLWFTINFNLLSFSAGILGPVVFGLGLRDSCLTIFFFNVLSVIPPAFFSTWGPQLGLRQMILTRYSFGYFGVIIPVIFNLLGLVGFCILNCILGGQTVAAIANGNLSWTLGIVIVALVSLFISFCGYKVLHWYERVAWVPILIALLVALGFGGKNLSNPVPVPDGTAPLILSFASIIAGFTITWSSCSCDFTCYLHPEGSRTKLFMYAYSGMFLSTTCLQLLGAAVGACMGNVPEWAAAYQANSLGGLFEAMLSPAGGFGKFLTFLIAMSVMGNIAATFYSITLNCQILIPALSVVPRYVFSLVATAVVIPLAIVGAHTYVNTLTNFLSLIGYWASPFIAILLEEHYIFRGGDFANYDISAWNVPSKLPTGLAAIGALACAFGIAIPSMDQVWYVGPIAKFTGDIGFEVGFVMGALTYPPLRYLEKKFRQI